MLVKCGGFHRSAALKPAINRELFLFESGGKLFKPLHRGSCGRVEVINHTKHKQAQARLTFFHHELMCVRRGILIQLYCFHVLRARERRGRTWKGEGSETQQQLLLYHLGMLSEGRRKCVCLCARELE